jgi:hypothetical protein
MWPGALSYEETCHTRRMSSGPLRPLPPPEFRIAQGNGKPSHVPLCFLGTTLLTPVPDPCQESLCNCIKVSWLPPRSADPMQDAPPWPSFSLFSPRKAGTAVDLTVWNSGEMDTCPSREDKTVLRCRLKGVTPFQCLGLGQEIHVTGSGIRQPLFLHCPRPSLAERTQREEERERINVIDVQPLMLCI